MHAPDNAPLQFLWRKLGVKILLGFAHDLQRQVIGLKNNVQMLRRRHPPPDLHLVHIERPQLPPHTLYGVRIGLDRLKFVSHLGFLNDPCQLPPAG